MKIQYLEIVARDVDAVCAAYAAALGARFGAPDPGLGHARTAPLAGGGRVGVRAPLRETEAPVVRPYWRVEDLEAAVAAAAGAGGELAVPPTEIPGRGAFAIYLQGGDDHGLWRLPPAAAGAPGADAAPEGPGTVVEAQMLVRRPVAEVFAAFVEPGITTRFWFTRSSGRLEPGAQVRWEWEPFGVGTDVEVKAIEENRRLLIEWDDPPRPVEWRFEPRGAEATLVRIADRGFRGDAGSELARALDSKGGFTMVLAGLKAWLEHGVALGLVADQFPDGLPRAPAGDPR